MIMLFNMGDYVSRNSYNNDTIFEIIGMDGENVFLKGVNKIYPRFFIYYIFSRFAFKLFN